VVANASSKIEPAPVDRPIWLVGMMGSGKSTVGPVLARHLGRAFLDSDREIERRAGSRVSEIFRTKGEAGFRALESAVIEDAIGGTAVVALGGGAIAQPGAAARLGAAGTVVYLRAQPAELMSRIGDPSSRPLLAGVAEDARIERLAELLAEREAAYLTAAIVIDTDGRKIPSIAQDLVARLTGNGAPVNRR
jgi:shikimate kinase